jgi:hypothetical protein
MPDFEPALQKTLVNEGGFKEDLFVTPVLLDRKVSQYFLEVGCRAPRAPAVTLRLDSAPVSMNLRLA